MKKPLLLILFLFSAVYTQAQCIGGGRYLINTFEYDSVIDLKYGSNINTSAQMQDLMLDIYLPKNDTFQKRPVIFFTHGGSFVSGSKESAESKYLCQQMAMKGYVTISHSYRLGIDEFSGNGATRSVWRGMQDARAAIRYIRSQGDVFKIDTNMIAYGGVSAGGFIALQTAFLDKPSELNSISGVDTLTIGGLEGNTNQLSNSSKVQAVLNLCGAIGDTSWIENSDINIPVLNAHGTNDDVVPYNTNMIVFLGFLPLMEVDGSNSIRHRLNNNNHPNRFYTYCGGGHVPFADPTPQGKIWLDSTAALITQFMYEDVLKCGIAPVRVSDIDSVECKTTGINYTMLDDVKIYPNPAQNTLNIETNSITSFSILNIQGQVILQKSLIKGNNKIRIADISKGIYLIRFTSGNEMITKKLMIE